MLPPESRVRVPPVENVADAATSRLAPAVTLVPDVTIRLAPAATTTCPPPPIASEWAAWGEVTCTALDVSMMASTVLSGNGGPDPDHCGSVQLPAAAPFQVSVAGPAT